MKLAWKGFELDFSDRAYVMGILNATPDSFSDGGLHLEKSSAIARAMEMEEEGADIIDIGGLSTRPGSEPVSVEEELRRTIPVIEALKGRLKAPISIDTYRADVAEAALMAGASMINDISGLRFDPRMAEVAARHKVPIVIMHIRGTPRDMQADPVYSDLMGEIMNYLKESIDIAKRAGIREDMIIIDPGIGFGKTFEHNIEIIGRLGELRALGRPILIGPSRKAFIGSILGGAPSERLEGTASAVAVSIFNGADMARVHDVREMAKVVKVSRALRRF